MISVIEGTLYYDRIDGTRSYWWKEYNLVLYVIMRDELDFIKTHAHLSYPGIYMLFSYSAPSEKSRLYVGQSTDISRRLKEHDKKKDFWDYAVVVQKYSGNMNNYEIVYLEHIAIKELSESGVFELIENTQIPALPYLDDKLKDKTEYLFEKIKELLSYSGFSLFLKNNKQSITLCPEQHNSVKSYEDISMNPEPIYGVNEDSDEPDMVVTYEAKSDDYSATVIELQDGRYMLLPTGYINKKIPISHNQKFINPSTGKIISDYISDNLEDISEIVSGSRDISIFTKFYQPKYLQF